MSVATNVTPRRDLSGASELAALAAQLPKGNPPLYASIVIVLSGVGNREDPKCREAADHMMQLLTAVSTPLGFQAKGIDSYRLGDGNGIVPSTRVLEGTRLTMMLSLEPCGESSVDHEALKDVSVVYIRNFRNLSRYPVVSIIFSQPLPERAMDFNGGLEFD